MKDTSLFGIQNAKDCYLGDLLKNHERYFLFGIQNATALRAP
jgi:hypothetical protein